jgi:hypothetical protein
MTHEQLWAVAQEPVPAAVVGAWGLLGAVIAVFIVRFRSDRHEGVKAGAALVAASVALAFLIRHERERSRSHDQRMGEVLARASTDGVHSPPERWPGHTDEPLHR